MKRLARWWIPVLLLAVSGCRPARDGTTDEATPAAGRLDVYSVNYPLAYFAERIGGDAVDVTFPVPPGVDPAFWRPDAEAIAGFQEADVILLNGADYAKWTTTASLPASRIVDTSASFRDRYIVTPNVVTHSHGMEGEHSHGGIAFTTWLDPELATEQARAVRDALIAAVPGREAAFRQDYDALASDLAALDGALREATAGKEDVPLLASHPVYQYLARRYRLDLEAVQFEPDEVPVGEVWEGLVALVKRHPARAMIWEAEPLPETVQKLRELGVATAVFDPCGRRPESGDYLSVMHDDAAALAKALSE